MHSYMKATRDNWDTDSRAPSHTAGSRRAAASKPTKRLSANTQLNGTYSCWQKHSGR